ncbi:hypothetical protein, partial [Tannerella forsythia]|uniref:hypothetical protein n=1 Tax=Tannerella forsythia TaxID=28112 RepID=UPI001C895666
ARISNNYSIYFIDKQFNEYILRSNYVRGGKESNCRICDKCGAVLYFPLPLNSWYLVDKSIPNPILFLSALTGIIVNDEIYQKVKKSGIKRIGYEKLSVLQENRWL